MKKKMPESFGSLGSWRKYDEKFDESIVKQTNDASCVSAVGEMLAAYYGLDISQSEILENIGTWANAENLVEFLNRRETETNVEWIGGGFPPEPLFIKDISRNQKWIVMLREGRWDGHAVLIEGIDETDLIIIKDPFDQTTYKMSIKDLYDVLSEFVLRRKK